MANTTTVTSPAPQKRRRWPRFLGIIAAIFILLIVVVYFVATSSGFLTGVILPRVSKSINADVTVSDASISPFKQVILHDLKVQAAGQEALLTAPEVRLRYSLMDIIGGNINIDEITISKPTIVLVQNPDGTSNLDPILKSQKEKPKSADQKPEQPGKPSKPPKIDLKKFALTDATVRQVKLYKNGNRDVAEVSHINVTLDGLKNGQTGKLTLGADIRVENNPPAPGTNGVLEAKVKGNFDFALTADLKPASIKGNTHLEVTRAGGALADVAALGSDLDCEVTPTDIKQVALHFQKGGVPLGELRVSGPFDMEKTEGRLTVQILSIDKQVLNLAGAKSGLDFGPTTINSTNEIQLTKAGAVITAAGRLDLSKFQVTRTNQTTPPLDFRAEYDVTVDRGSSNALLRVLNFTGTQKGNPLLRAELSSPMNLSWGNAANAVGDSALNLTVTKFDLTNWKAFIGDSASSGLVNAKMKLLSQQGGKLLTFDLNSQIDNLTAGAGSNQISQATVTLQVNGKATDLKQFNLSEYRLQVAQQNQPLVTVFGSGVYDQPTAAADMQVTVQAALVQLLKAAPQPDLSVSSGTVELKTHILQKQETQTVTGSLVLADFTGRSGKNEFHSFGTTVDLDITKTPRQIQIRKIAGKLTEGANAGGSFDVSGTYDLTNKTAQMTAKLTYFNQNGLRAFLEPALADKKLVSVAINVSASAQYNPEGDSSVKADFQMANLVVNDPKNQFPASPLEAKMQVDASVHKKVADVRQFQLTLTPTQRAKNELNLTGHVDMSQTNATTGNLKLAADSLDMTSYYDLFAGEKKSADKKPADKQTASRSPAASNPSSAPANPNKEPEPTKLPLRNFTADVSIGRFYLKEVEITNWLTTARIDGGHVVLNPFKLALNGAPVSTTIDLDLGVPGYKYDMAFSAQAIPLAPFINSFQPERKGQLGGTLTAQAKIGGTGITGASLQKNLACEFEVLSTNLNLAVVNIKSPLLKTLVNVIAAVPELARNPGTAVVAMFGKGGLSDDLSKSPLDAIMVRGAVGAGKAELQQAVVQSAAFKSEAAGTVALAEVLTNSTLNIPVSVLLSRGVAHKLGLEPASASASDAYVKLPDFLTMKGTVGDPKADINKLALAGTAFKTIGNVVTGFGGKTGSLIKNAGDLLTGVPSSTNAPPSAGTNQPPAINDLLNKFLKPKKK